MIPADLRHQVINSLYSGYTGVTKMPADSKTFWLQLKKKDLGEKLKASTASMNYSKYSKSKNDSTEKKLTKTGQENQIDFSGKLR